MLTCHLCVWLLQGGGGWYRVDSGPDWGWWCCTLDSGGARCVVDNGTNARLGHRWVGNTVQGLSS